MQTLAFLLARLSEPSSYAGLGALLALAGLNFSDSVLGQLAQFLAAGCGLAALFLKERGLIQMIVIAAMLSTALGACGTTTQPTSTTIQTGAHRDRAGDVRGARRGQSGKRRRRRRGRQQRRNRGVPSLHGRRDRLHLGHHDPSRRGRMIRPAT